ncbi:putative cytochrome c oxidase copper chaperone (COX17) [Babesia divergens]|uniref:Cytochrome c oxidase copper chaperone (COX17) n=1 Tax=Babesia divergens TaxID=32595 RepID=A0AAD9LHE4_BABDI|nr:putative cytochrome c oxidase copper chaperone (COX17) [Babesia divergens]
MGSQVSKPVDSTQATSAKPSVSTTGKRICCVCKETKAARDECIAQKGEEQCLHLIDLHNQCLRKEGFTVD